MFRLTVHLKDVQKVDAPTGSKIKNAKGKFVKETKRKIFNTKSQVCKTLADCEKLLNDWRIKYTIAKGKNPQKKHKYDKELFNISFVK